MQVKEDVLKGRKLQVKKKETFLVSSKAVWKDMQMTKISRAKILLLRDGKITSALKLKVRCARGIDCEVLQTYLSYKPKP